jgi:hypothetical protein
VSRDIYFKDSLSCSKNNGSMTDRVGKNFNCGFGAPALSVGRFLTLVENDYLNTPQPYYYFGCIKQFNNKVELHRCK